MNPGDLVFVSGTGLIARLVKWVTKSKWSHVSVYLGDGNVMEAQALRPVGLSRIVSYNAQFDAIPLPSIVTPEQRQKGLYWLYMQRGRHYSYWSDFVILMRNVFGIMIPWHEGDDIICSRLARDFLAECGLPIPDEDMSPEDVYEWLTSFSSQHGEDTLQLSVKTV
jgi:hypothetical protein